MGKPVDGPGRWPNITTTGSSAIAEKLKLGDVEVQSFGNPADATLRFGTQPGGDVAQQSAVDRVRAAVENDYDVRRVEVVGPRVSGELVQSGTLGVVLAIIGVMAIGGVLGLMVKTKTQKTSDES